MYMRLLLTIGNIITMAFILEKTQLLSYTSVVVEPVAAQISRPVIGRRNRLSSGKHGNVAHSLIIYRGGV